MFRLVHKPSSDMHVRKEISLIISLSHTHTHTYIYIYIYNTELSANNGEVKLVNKPPVVALYTG